MAKIHIWRMHNEFMGGPYCGKGNIGDYVQAHDTAAKRVAGHQVLPWKDEGLTQYFKCRLDFTEHEEDLRCGFNNLAGYKQWFPSKEFQSACDATGFFLSRYSIDKENAMLGARQAVFNPAKAVITAFRRCNQSGIMRSVNDITHKPILRFLENPNCNIQIDLPGL